MPDETALFSLDKNDAKPFMLPVPLSCAFNHNPSMNWS